MYTRRRHQDIGPRPSSIDDMAGLGNILVEIKERESAALKGLRLYLTECLSDYLDMGKILEFADVLISIKKRPADRNSIDKMCIPIHMQPCLRSKNEPHRILEIRNLYALIFNLTGYINVNRQEAAMILKSSFPVIFERANVTSINKSLTRHKLYGCGSSQKIEYLESPDPEKFERLMIMYSERYSENTGSNTFGYSFLSNA